MSEIENALHDLQEALETGDSLQAGKSCSVIGQIFLERNLYQEAAQYYQQASDHFESAENVLLQAKSLNHLGICLVMQNKPLAALDILNNAFRLIDAADAELAAAIQGNLGLAHNALNDHKNAIKAHKLVLEIAENRGDESLRLNALINLADSNLQEKEYTAALGFALVALDLAKKIHSPSGLIITYDLLGMISSRQGNLQAAVEYHQQSFQAAEEFGDLLRQGIALANKGLALEGLTDLQAAHQALSQAADLFRLLNSDYVEKTREDLARVRNALPG
jgi:tetratricopeptide (TPR) repeat protein